MRLRTGIGLAATLCAQVVALHVVLSRWPSGAALAAFLLLLFVFTPLMLAFCIDVVREFKARTPSAASLLGRIVFSLPLLVLALLSILIGCALTIAFGSMLFSDKALPFLVSLPELLAVLAIFFAFGFCLLRMLLSRKHDDPTPWFLR